MVEMASPVSVTESLDAQYGRKEQSLTTKDTKDHEGKLEER